MAGPRHPGQGAQGGASADADAWLSAVAEASAAAAAAPVELLGEYLTMLAEAAVTGRRPQPEQLTAVHRLGELAAEMGVGAGRAVDLYLTAAWQLWHQLPDVVRRRDRDQVRIAAEAVLRVIDDAVEAMVNGHQAARRHLIRLEETMRREFVDDLLRGDADVSRMMERAQPFGLDLGQAHRVALAVPLDENADIERAAIRLERVVVDRYGDRDVLVATKDRQLVTLVPAALTSTQPTGRAEDVVTFLERELEQLGMDGWRVAAGRSFTGLYGVARSYEEAREAIMWAERLHLDGEVVDDRDLLVYRVVGRDHAALVDLVRASLGPLTQVRGGAGPMLDTLETYFATGAVATETARRLYVSVRTVTYRLARVKSLTGLDPHAPTQRFLLQASVLGARLLDWPARDLPGEPLDLPPPLSAKPR